MEYYVNINTRSRKQRKQNASDSIKKLPVTAKEDALHAEILSQTVIDHCSAA
jgi:hypothetical protein